MEPFEHISPIRFDYGLPIELTDIIFSFAYPLRNLKSLNRCAYFSWLTSKTVAIPKTWKKLLMYEDGFRIFNWTEFLKTNFNPYSAQTIIKLSAVRETVRNLNWHYVVQMRVTASSWCLARTKKQILQDFSFWTPFTERNIFLLQRLLCSVDCSACLNKHARERLAYSSVLICNPYPLCKFLNYPRH